MSLLSHHPYQKILLARELRERRERVLAHDFSGPVTAEEVLQQERKQNMSMSDDDKIKAGCFVIIVAFVLLLIPILMWGLPLYNVWKSELQGKAELVRAEQNRQIKIEEAKANLEAEKLNAEAEVERAKGAAKAIEIENGKLTDTYIKYLAVRTFNTDNAKFVYIPTECGIVPYLMEAGRGPKVDFPKQVNK